MASIRARDQLRVGSRTGAGGLGLQLQARIPVQGQGSGESRLYGHTPPGARTDPGKAQAAGLPSEGDLAFARAAASEALTRGGKDVSVPWENPGTGARGTVTPLPSTSNQDGVLCRDFLVSYVHEANELWLQGEACRMQDGKWDVRNLRPWKRS